MARGGKRPGAGRKRTRKLYKRRKTIGKRAFRIGRLCDFLWRKACEKSEKRPRWKPVIARVARRLALPRTVVEKHAKDYQQLMRDLRTDIKNYQPDIDNARTD